MKRNQPPAVWKKDSFNSLRKSTNWLLLLNLTLLINLLTVGQSYAQSTSNQQKDNYKLYAHMQLLKASEYECFDQLIFRESRWNVYATNGNHWGLGQGQSKWLKNKDAYQQIDWVIRYIKSRYKSTCIALAHSVKRGWY